MKADDDAIWDILGQTIGEAETYALPRTWTREEVLSYWSDVTHCVYLAELGRKPVGTYYLRPNQLGGGSHVANCGYVTAPHARGNGVARQMCLHSIEEARRSGFRAMQFNFVVGSNHPAVALWRSLSFSVLGTIPEAFRHPRLGYVDAFVMHRFL